MNIIGANIYWKFWFFIRGDVEVEIINDIEQQLTIKILFTKNLKSMLVTMVHVKCTKGKTLDLWNNICSRSSSNDLPWLIRGDFNAILNEEEEIRGFLLPNKK